MPSLDKAHHDGLIWRADLTLQPDAGTASARRQSAIEKAQLSRPATARIEREIMIAVVVLYSLILGSFAALHLYGSYALLPAEATITEPVAP